MTTAPTRSADDPRTMGRVVARYYRMAPQMTEQDTQTRDTLVAELKRAQADYIRARYELEAFDIARMREAVQGGLVSRADLAAKTGAPQ